MRKLILILGMILLLAVAAYAAAAMSNQQQSSVISFNFPGRTLPNESGALTPADQYQLLGLYSGFGAEDSTKSHVDILDLKRRTKR